MQGSADPKCSATGTNHRFDKVQHERALETERKKKEAERTK